MSKEKRPIVGVPGYKLGDNSFGCGVNHLDFISRFGNPRILFAQDDDADIDLLYLTGGADLDPSCYGQIPGFYTTNQDVFKQYFFNNNLAKYVKKGIPIFGACLGFQMLNVFFKGSLHQDMKYHAQSKDRWQEGHDVFTVGLTRKDGKFKVNSHHHQAVLYSDLSKELEMLVYADNEENREDCIVEAFIHKTLPIAACQWHSEEWRDPFTSELIKSLLKSKS